MYYILRISLLVTLCLAMLSTQAQQRNYDAYSASKRLKLANITLKKGSVYSAIEHLKAVTIQDPDNVEPAYELGNAYLLARDYGRASVAFQRAQGLNKKNRYPCLFKLGQSLKYEGKYEDAKKAFIEFSKSTFISGGKINYKSLCTEELSGIEQAMALMKAPPIPSEIVNQSDINIPYSDFSPAYMPDSSLIFSSLRQDSVITLGEEEENTYQVKLYKASKNEAQFQNAEKIEDLDFYNQHSANGTFNVDKTRFYFNRCKTDAEGKTLCKIYMAPVENGIIGRGKVVEETDMPEFTSTQPTVASVNVKGKKQEIIYFSSDRPRGQGGFDIWYITYDYENKKFGRVSNAGKGVNSKYDEKSPYYHEKTKKLYFASNSVMGLGGYDVFVAEGEENRFSAAVNVGYPLNSSADDYYFVVGDNDKKGFIVSNRPGGKAMLSPTCCDDIYTYALKTPISELVKKQIGEGKPVLEPDSNAVALGDSDGNSNNGTDTTDYSNAINPKTGKKYTDKEKKVEEGIKRWKNKAKNRVVSKINANTPDQALHIDHTKDGNATNQGKDGENNPTQTNDKTGKTSKTGDKTGKLADKTNKTGVDKTSKGNQANTQKAGEEEPEFVQKQEKPVAELVVYYDFDKDDLKDKYHSEIDNFLKVAKLHNDARISIEAHTDSVGTSAYNRDLAERRAVSVVRYLLMKDTPEEKLLSRSFGEGRPKARNTNADGTDNAAGRALNRRVSLVLLK